MPSTAEQPSSVGSEDETLSSHHHLRLCLEGTTIPPFRPEKQHSLGKSSPAANLEALGDLRWLSQAVAWLRTQATLSHPGHEAMLLYTAHPGGLLELPKYFIFRSIFKYRHCVSSQEGEAGEPRSPDTKAGVKIYLPSSQGYL